MSDLCLAAALLAKTQAADPLNPIEPELPTVASLSNQVKHQSVHPLALTLHQASIETYSAEFSRGDRGRAIAAANPVESVNQTESALLSRPAPLSQMEIEVFPPQIQGQAAGRPHPPLSTPAVSPPVQLTGQRLPKILPAPMQLSPRPLLTNRGNGSISALPAAVRPVALKLHQASLETYATLLETAPPDLAHPDIADAGEQRSPQPMSPVETTMLAALSPMAQALGMAQAAGAAQSVARNLSVAQTSRVARTSGTAELNSPPPSKTQFVSHQTKTVEHKTTDKRHQTAIQAAIALDQQVRAQQADAALTSSALPVNCPPIGNMQTSVEVDENVTISSATTANPTIQLSPADRTRPTAAAVAVRKQPITRPIVNSTVNPTATHPTLALRPNSLPPLIPTWPQSPRLGPRSGPQLYQQRLAALKQGKLHSRLPADSFKSLWNYVRYKPSYGQWQRLLAAEARSVGNGQGNNRLSIVLGDSLSLWLPMQQLPNSQIWLNQGISGDTTRGILKRLEPLKQTRPTSIYVMAGVNDLKNGVGDREVLNNLQQIMRRLRQQHPQAQVYVQSILPASIGLPPGRIRGLNVRIAQIAQAERVAFLNIYPQFVAPNGEMIAQLTTDGIHLSPQGYALWQSILRNMERRWADADITQPSTSSSAPS